MENIYCTINHQTPIANKWQRSPRAPNCKYMYIILAETNKKQILMDDLINFDCVSYGVSSIKHWIEVFS